MIATCMQAERANSSSLGLVFLSCTIEGFHRVTFVSNFDVNVEIGGHFGDQERTKNTLWRLRQQCKCAVSTR